MFPLGRLQIDPRLYNPEITNKNYWITCNHPQEVLVENSFFITNGPVTVNHIFPLSTCYTKCEFGLIFEVHSALLMNALLCNLASEPES